MPKPESSNQNSASEPHDAEDRDEQAVRADAALDSEMPAEDESSEAPLGRLRQELGEANDRVLRAQADLENYRRRAQREMAETVRYATVPLLKDLLPVMDNVQRAIEAAEKSGDADSLLQGFKMVASQLETALNAHHCQKIEALHQPFDPNKHEAVQQQPNDKFPPQTVVVVLQEGYQLHDRVIRPSQVIVSMQPA